jgi:hypothetical protein
MSEQVPLNMEERELEARLHRLVPSSHGLQRDHLMFQAGRRAGHPQLRLWQTLSTVLFLGSLTLGWLSLGPEPRSDPSLLVQIEPVVEPAPPVTDRREPPPGRIVLGTVTHPSGYLRLRELVLLEGAEALPDAPAAPITDPTGLGLNWPTDLPLARPLLHRFHLPNHGDRS